MASNDLPHKVVEFTATIQHTKDRLVAIPAQAQRMLALEQRPESHTLHVSIRPAGRARWDHHYLELTCYNEFSIPADLPGYECGEPVDVKVHAVLADEPVEEQRPETSSGAELLLKLLERPRPAGWRTDGSTRVDEYLREQIRDEMRR